MSKLKLTRLTMARTWGKAPPSPLIVYYVVAHKAHIQMTLCPKTPKWESQNYQNWDSRKIWGPYNFVCRPPIKIRSKTKLYPSLRAFQWYVTRHLHKRKSGRLVTFNGQQSNCQFDSRPFFCP
jgi:hypothetical protein